MTSKKPASSKRAPLPRASDYTKGFRKDWGRQKKHVDNPPEMWIRKEGAFNGIVPVATFMAAQERLSCAGHGPGGLQARAGLVF